MQPHNPSPTRDPSRLHALYRTALLDSPAEESFDRLARLAVKILRIPVALVSLVDRDRQFFKSCIGLAEPLASERQTPLSHSFCQHTIASAEPLIIEDARTHPLVADNRAVVELQVIAYLGIPLILSDGSAIGSFCAIDTQPHSWTNEDVDIMRELAASVITEIELRLATNEAQDAVREREAVLSIASHELRTPITSVLGYAQLLEKRFATGQEVSERDLRAIRAIRLQGERMNVLLNRIFDATQLDVGQVVHEIAPIDLGQLVAQVIGETTVNAQSHEIQLHAPAEAVLVNGDATQLGQVVQNLLGNAIKYSPTGGRITITVSHDEHHASLAIQDTGIGIPNEALPRLFQRFSRVRSASTDRISGLGLGLYIVKEIVTMYGGSINVESSEGVGSTFTVRLPLVRPAE